MAKRLTRITNSSHRIFSWPASFHCQSGRRAMSTRATIIRTSDPMAMANQTMKKMAKKPIPAPASSAIVMVAPE
jgi:hypothetical protein